MLTPKSYRNRFRISAGLISWQAKIGSDAMKDYLDALLPPICLATNSTRPFRNLHAHEIEEIKCLNAGCFPNKARAANRDCSEANKQKIFHEAAEKYRRKRKAFDGSTQFTSTFYRVQQVRAQREGRPNSIEHDSYEEIEGEEDELDLDMSPDTDSQASVPDTEEIYHELDLDTSPNAESQASVPDTAEKVIDFRELCPTTYSQIDLISIMLEPSRLQFFYMTGVTAPSRSSCESYRMQYDRLQSALNNAIVKAGVEDYNCTLIGLTDFTDEKWTWNGPWCLEAFGTEPERDQISVKIVAIKQELAAATLEPMEVADIEALDFSIANDG